MVTEPPRLETYPFTLIYLLIMAYRRPLSLWQMILLGGLWVALVLWILLGSDSIDGMTLLILVLSGILVFYPIWKSWRERRGD